MKEPGMKTNASDEGMKVTRLPDGYSDEPRAAVRSELVIDVHVRANGNDIEAECKPATGKNKVFKNGWIHYGGGQEPILFKFVLHVGEGIHTLAFMIRQPILAGNPSATFGSCAEHHDWDAFRNVVRISDSEASVDFHPGNCTDDRAYALNVSVVLDDGRKLLRALDPRIINR
jgi:hypothetical protein